MIFYVILELLNNILEKYTFLLLSKVDTWEQNPLLFFLMFLERMAVYLFSLGEILWKRNLVGLHYVLYL